MCVCVCMYICITKYILKILILKYELKIQYIQQINKDKKSFCNHVNVLKTQQPKPKSKSKCKNMKSQK